jgi:alpha-galactosidase
MTKLKIALIGAGSVSFALGTLHDIVLSKRLGEIERLEVAMMDIVSAHLNKTWQYAEQLLAAFDSKVKLTGTLDLETALTDADFVVSAIEVDRYFYWSQDFHIPRLYGSKQIYGENGGPGSFFHTLRNMPPTIHIAKTMERLCPDALLLNFTNPEAKLVEAVSKLTKIKVVGLCHGLDMGIDMISRLLETDKSDVEIEGGGLNHFGFFTRITSKASGKDLYPLLREKEANAGLLAQFDHAGLLRAMFHLYGLFPYPGTNHCGEYISWTDGFYAGLSLQYRYDPLREKPWEKGARQPEFVYCASGNTLDKGFFDKGVTQEDWMAERFVFDKNNVSKSGEYAIPIIEALTFNERLRINAANMTNHGAIKWLPDDMVVETQAVADGNGIRLIPMKTGLPTAVVGMIYTQGIIHQLLIEAFTEKSKTKLLQAILLDPQAPTYYQACAMIDDLCHRQSALLPELEWK